MESQQIKTSDILELCTLMKEFQMLESTKPDNFDSIISAIHSLIGSTKYVYILKVERLYFKSTNGDGEYTFTSIFREAFKFESISDAEKVLVRLKYHVNVEIITVSRYYGNIVPYALPPL